MRPGAARALGITAFGTNSWRGENVGDRLVPEHAEDPRATRTSSTSSSAGRARFEVDDDTFDAPAGTLVFSRRPEPADRLRGGAGHGGARGRRDLGQAYEADGWEIWAPFTPRTRPATTRA